MNIALVDDEPSLLAATHRMLEDALTSLGLEPDRLDTFESGDALLAAFAPGGYDLILLDIYMPGLTGVELARRLREQDGEVLLAFCTSSNEFASESYEVNAAYYLQKPVTVDKLTAMLRRLDLAERERRRPIRLPDGFRCPRHQILYTEYSNHAVTFHLNGAPSHSVYMSQGEAEALLHHKAFRSINKGCIVNFRMVSRLADGAFLMKNGETLPIARRRYKEIAEAYTQYRFDTLEQEVTAL